MVPAGLAGDERVDLVKRHGEQHPEDRREEEAAHNLADRVSVEVAGWRGVAGPRIIEALVFLLEGRERW